MNKPVNYRNKRCVIITSYLENPLPVIYVPETGDYIIAADRGYLHATGSGVIPDLVVGDFDSLGGDKISVCETKIIRTPAEKDDTDTMLAVKLGLAAGYRDFFIVGGIGGRLDHTYANLQALSYCIDNGAAVWISDGSNKTTMTDASEFTLKKEDGYYFSLFSWSERSSGVTIQNAKYLLSDAVLSRSSPLGVSNEFLEDSVQITKKSGRLLIILSQKDLGI
ncbi:thiamine pyrophosphokinase [Clostridia bacterium]|nr:thiamine pyrophosphokinase [Clostridia bacterium]